jgi:ketosteroid isomerase-like protein
MARRTVRESTWGFLRVGFRTVTQENIDLVLAGYQAFLRGDFAEIAELLDEDVEWVAAESGGLDAAHRDSVLEVLADRSEELPRVVLERCVGVGDQVVVYFRASETIADPDDDRLLQTRRSYTIGRYAGVITIRDGRVVRIQDYPHVHAALDAVGLASEFR